MRLISWPLQSGSEQYGITQGHVTLCIGICIRHVHRVRAHCIMQGYIALYMGKGRYRWYRVLGTGAQYAMWGTGNDMKATL